MTYKVIKKGNIGIKKWILIKKRNSSENRGLRLISFYFASALSN